jgi:hypothetical protein
MAPGLNVSDVGVDNVLAVVLVACSGGREAVLPEIAWSASYPGGPGQATGRYLVPAGDTLTLTAGFFDNGHSMFRVSVTDKQHPADSVSKTSQEYMGPGTGLFNANFYYVIHALRNSAGHWFWLPNFSRLTYTNARVTGEYSNGVNFIPFNHPIGSLGPARVNMVHGPNGATITMSGFTDGGLDFSFVR